MTKKPKAQKTPNGHEIPVPTRGDFFMGIFSDGTLPTPQCYRESLILLRGSYLNHKKDETLK